MTGLNCFLFGIIAAQCFVAGFFFFQYRVKTQDFFDTLNRELL